MAKIITKDTTKGKPFAGKGKIVEATKGGKGQAVAQVALNKNGTAMRLWWQVPCDIAYKAKVRLLMAKMGHGNLNSLGKALLDKAIETELTPKEIDALFGRK